jgi:uncharacterized protein (DUF2141 family)
MVRLNQVIPVGIFLLNIATAIGQNYSSNITITNFSEKTKGKIYIAWYNQPSKFLDQKYMVYSKIVPISKQKSVTTSFEDIPKGEYAVAVFIDENDNGVLDTNFLGIPTEYYGFSNNVLPLTRAPTYKESKFSITTDHQIIKIRVK